MESRFRDAGFDCCRWKEKVAIPSKNSRKPDGQFGVHE